MPATAARRSQYADSIRHELAAMGFVGMFDPRHVEAYMRLEHSTLDGLSAAQFRSEVAMAAECIRAGGVADAEGLALSYGL